MSKKNLLKNHVLSAATATATTEPTKSYKNPCFIGKAGSCFCSGSGFTIFFTNFKSESEQDTYNHLYNSTGAVSVKLTNEYQIGYTTKIYISGATKNL